MPKSLAFFCGEVSFWLRLRCSKKYTGYCQRRCGTHDYCLAAGVEEEDCFDIVRDLTKMEAGGQEPSELIL